MTQRNWFEKARTMLNVERQMQPLQRPPSVGCLVSWRDKVKVGVLQRRITEEHPALAYLTITSRYDEPEYIDAIRLIEPDRLELKADPRLELDRDEGLESGSLLCVHMENNFAMVMDAEERSWFADHISNVLRVEPANGFSATVGHARVKFTTNQAPGAIPNHSLVEKVNSQPGEIHPDGTFARILGSIGPAQIPGIPDRYGYWVEWETHLSVPAFVRESKVRIYRSV